ncbi:unnamed protein product [Mytilus edulis]|uniref:Uncharacterized protein n=1 Tax=Mytilus edulis TaxID=6550 RepID=A0A8S3UNW7_MYTED|nr:unnamed protein product [Mytilus edulis]
MDILSKFEKEEETLNKLDFIHCQKYEEAQRNIKERENFVIEEVKKHTQTLLNELHEKWGVISSDISEQKSKISEIKSDLLYYQFHSEKADGTNKLDIFDFTWRITTNSNEDICIVDLSTSSVKGRIVTLDKDGNLKWVYDGHPSDIPTEHFFLPENIATTYLGNIIVCDTRNSAIHLLNAQDSIIAYK